MQLTNINQLKIKDDKTNEVYYGCDQAWYSNIWKQKAGCGPSASCNIFMYVYYKRLFGNYNVINKKSAIKIMDEMWHYVTPSIRGVNTTKMLYDGILEYAKSKGLYLNYFVLDIPQGKSARPKMDEAVKFITNGLEADCPVAFLNLCNGEEKSLYRWHWVTIVEIDAKDIDNAVICILDEGKILYINLSLWLKTTTLGGGFVYFTI
ncbi:MAG: hypothetical protein GYA50_03570 [Eubacteriaceae bacterium]|nr:hypothetical protein [Eubacteriaceae bacterium]